MLNTKRRQRRTCGDEGNLYQLTVSSGDYRTGVIHRTMLRDPEAVIVDVEGSTDRMWPGFAVQR